MEITQKTQFNFEFKIDNLTYTFSVIANSEKEAKEMLKSNLEKITKEL